jgi:2'-5' RNA ligase
LFLALWPGPETIRLLAEQASRWTFPADALRYAPHDWHVTLHFLGSVAAERIPVIAAGMEIAFEPFELLLDQPQRWHRGLAVLGASYLPPGLRALHERLGEALNALGQPLEDRPYRPHVTLARRAASAQPPLQADPIVLPGRHFALVVSTGNATRRYEILREYPCAGSH